MEDSKAGFLDDYKFFCFDGKVRCVMTCTDRFSGKGLKATFFDKDWNKLPFARHYAPSEDEIGKPVNYQKMVELAEKLSAGMPFVRTDFYDIDGRLYFGELTFYPGSGMEEFIPEEADLKVGKWIELPGFAGGAFLVEIGDDTCLLVRVVAPDEGLSDYKVMCFSGKPRLIQVHRGRFTHHTQDYYDEQWNKLHIEQGVPSSSFVMDKPAFLEEMLRLSELLAKGVPQVRIDWYCVDGQLYFGEITFFDGSGFYEFVPKELNMEYGSWIELPSCNGRNAPIVG